MVGLSSFAGACQAISVTPSATAISISLTPFRPTSIGATRVGSGKYNEHAVAEIGYPANCGIDRDEPYNERHNIMLHPALGQR
jgi:hypothetical protein